MTNITEREKKNSSCLLIATETQGGEKGYEEEMQATKEEGTRMCTWTQAGSHGTYDHTGGHRF